MEGQSNARTVSRVAAPPRGAVASGRRAGRGGGEATGHGASEREAEEGLDLRGRASECAEERERWVGIGLLGKSWAPVS